MTKDIIIKDIIGNLEIEDLIKIKNDVEWADEIVDEEIDNYFITYAEMEELIDLYETLDWDNTLNNCFFEATGNLKIDIIKKIKNNPHF